MVHHVSQFISVNGDGFYKIPGIEALPGAGIGVSFSSDGTYLAVIYSNSPYLTIYKRSGDVFFKLSGISTGMGQGVSFSSDGTYLAVTSTDSPYLNVYKRSGDKFTKLSGIEALPGWGDGVSFSNDDTYLAVACYSSPFITVYKRSGDAFTKLTRYWSTTKAMVMV